MAKSGIIFSKLNLGFKYTIAEKDLKYYCVEKLSNIRKREQILMPEKKLQDVLVLWSQEKYFCSLC